MSLKKLFDEENKKQIEQGFFSSPAGDEQVAETINRLSHIIDVAWSRYDVERTVYGDILCNDSLMSKVFAMIMYLRKRAQDAIFQAIYLEEELPVKSVRLHPDDLDIAVRSRTVLSENRWEGSGFISVEGIMATESGNGDANFLLMVGFRKRDFFILEREEVSRVMHDIRQLYPRTFKNTDSIIELDSHE